MTKQSKQAKVRPDRSTVFNVIIQSLTVYCSLFSLAGDGETPGAGCEGHRVCENGSKKTPCTQKVTPGGTDKNTYIYVFHYYLMLNNT